MAEAVSRFETWMTQRALPLWSRTGHDGFGRGFIEQMTLAGQPDPVGYKRVRVQARQIYVFSHAAVLGWRDGLAVAADGMAFLAAHARAPDGRWARRLDRDGNVLDATADLYDLAFVLLACAWHARATGEAWPIDWARTTLAWIEAHMGLAGQPGFHNAMPVEPGPQQQNPHMHLLEAALALYEASGEPCFARCADAMLALFEAHLFDPRSGTLAELFAPDWRRLRAGEGGAAIEPGHQFEWSWLLHTAFRLRRRDLRHAAGRLHQFAATHGTDAERFLVLNGVDEAGRPVDAGTRLWPQTEAIRSHLLNAAPGHAGIAVARLIENLLGRFLADTPEGTWIDRFDSAGRPNAPMIPASSLYHLFAAYAELRCLAGR